MKVGSALLCLLASPLLCLVPGSPTRAQSFEGPVSFGGPGVGGG
jgi:hypothetical protein